MLRLPNAVASVAYEMQPKLHFLRTSHPRQRIFHAVCSFLKRSLSCISYVHRILSCGVLLCSYSLITVTSSYRICTCFPFHRSQLHISCHKSDSNACLLRHLYATYSVSSCVAYAIAWIIILQLVTLFNRFLSDALQTHLQKRCKKLQNTLQQPACK